MTLADAERLSQIQDRFIRRVLWAANSQDRRDILSAWLELKQEPDRLMKHFRKNARKSVLKILRNIRFSARIVSPEPSNPAGAQI